MAYDLMLNGIMRTCFVGTCQRHKVKEKNCIEFQINLLSFAISYVLISGYTVFQDRKTIKFRSSDLDQDQTLHLCFKSNK